MPDDPKPLGLSAVLNGIFAQGQDRTSTTVAPAVDTAAARAGAEAVRSTLDQLLSPEESLERAVRQLGLEAVVLTLARRHGAKAIRGALEKLAGGQEKGPAVHAVRHALTLFCKKKGCTSETAVGWELAAIFPPARGSRRDQKAESLRKLVGKAKEKCAADPLGLRFAEEVSDEWAAKYKNKLLRDALRALKKPWKTDPYP